MEMEARLAQSAWENEWSSLTHENLQLRALLEKHLPMKEGAQRIKDEPGCSAPEEWRPRRQTAPPRQERRSRWQGRPPLHAPAGEHWTSHTMQEVAESNFDARGDADHVEVRITMGSISPPLTAAGMERYCEWLSSIFTSFKQKHGGPALRNCKALVDFSSNDLCDDMVWALMEVFVQHEVHVSVLDLSANRISHGGVLAVCEFMHMNDRAGPLHELRMSHNRIEDESVLLLLRTLHGLRPKYPPHTEQSEVAPLWLCLDSNWIRTPGPLVIKAEFEGIGVCTAWDRESCGIHKCHRAACPVAHLPAISTQARQESPRGGSGDRRNRCSGHRSGSHFKNSR